MISRSQILEIFSNEERNIEKVFSLFETLSPNFNSLSKDVFLRGLIELSNVCNKNCFYCGLRKDNKKIKRYVLSDNDFVESVELALELGIKSIVIQSGEATNKNNINSITKLLNKIKKIDDDNIAITLSLGEQDKDTLAQWKDAGASRYLLRIETSNPLLYQSIHPNDPNHNFKNRLNTLESLRLLDYQVGTGVLIGLPGQTNEDLVNDLWFLKEFDIDMVGMGPYIPHSETPMFRLNNRCTLTDSYFLTLKMIAALRLLIPDINIAATTALQSLSDNGLVDGLKFGANVIMPNITPLKYRENYSLYENKKLYQFDKNYLFKIQEIVNTAGKNIDYLSPGTSKRYLDRNR